MDSTTPILNQNNLFQISGNAVARLLLYLFIDLFCFLVLNIATLNTIIVYLLLVGVFLSSVYLEYRTSKVNLFTKSPIVYTFYTFIFVYIGGLIFLFFSNSIPIWVVPFDSIIVLKGLFITNLGLHAIWSGFHLFKKLNFKILGFPSLKGTSFVKLNRIFLILGISILSILIAIYTGAFGFVARDAESMAATSGFSQYLTMGRELSFFGVIILTYYYYNTKKYRPIIYTVLIFFFFVGLAFGSKSSGVFYIMYFVLTLLFMGKKFSVKFIWWGLVAIIVAYSVVEPFRHYYMYGGGKKIDTSSISGMIEVFKKSREVTENKSSRNESELVLIGIGFVNRISYTVPLSKAIKYADAHNYTVPKDYRLSHIFLSPLYAFIPRFIWKTKPKLYFGRWYSKNVMGMDEFVSVGTTPQGYLYMAGGYFGVISIFFLLGVIHKILYDSLFSSKIAVPLYIFMFLKFGGLADLTWAYLSGLFKFILIYFIIYAFIISKKKIIQKIK